MQRGRRRKIKVSQFTQPQFELGDTAEDIERRRREREDGREPRKGRKATTNSHRCRQKKGQMKFIFLSDSDEEAIVEFIKQHEELCNKTHDKFKDKQRKEGLWERVAASRNLSVNIVKNWFETQCTRYCKLTQTKSGQAAEKSTER